MVAELWPSICWTTFTSAPEAIARADRGVPQLVRVQVGHADRPRRRAERGTEVLTRSGWPFRMPAKTRSSGRLPSMCPASSAVRNRGIGTSMTSKPVAQLLFDLGVDRSHSRPRVSNDNPFSEAAFKTLKYAPVFPEAFGSLADARAFAEAFFGYNHERRHSGIGLHTPASVHHGAAAEIRAQRQHTLGAANTAYPQRFGNRRPQAPELPKAAWINQPSPEALIQTA